jgi:hypothetical protein
MIGEPPRALAFVTCVLRGARAERGVVRGVAVRALRGCLCRGVGKRNGGLQRDASSACARTQLKSWKGIHVFDPLCITEGAFDKHVVLYENGSALFARDKRTSLRRTAGGAAARRARSRPPPPPLKKCLTHITCHPRALALSW